MEITVPHYYKKFRCIAGDCPDTCCAGWQIMIDDRTLKKYRKLKGAFGNRVKNSVNWRTQSFYQYQRRCAFLNEDNLCDLYLEGGEALFCKTCRRYPRHIEEFEGCREISLSLSCMAAARIILGTEEKVRFLTKEIETNRQEDYGDFDYFLFSNLLDIRQVLVACLQDRGLATEQRIKRCLRLTEAFQKKIEEEKLFETQALLEQFSIEEKAVVHEPQKAAQGAETVPDGMTRKKILRLFRVFRYMETLQEDWEEEWKAARRFFEQTSEETYAALQRDFSAACEEQGFSLEILREQLMVYYVFTYFAGAVYDGQAEEKFKMAAAATALTEHLAMARWQRNGGLSLEEFIWTAHRFSKEIEHSDLNIERMEHLMRHFSAEDF